MIEIMHKGVCGDGKEAARLTDVDQAGMTSSAVHASYHGMGNLRDLCE